MYVALFKKYITSTLTIICIYYYYKQVIGYDTFKWIGSLEAYVLK